MNQIVITEVSVKVKNLPKYVQPVYDQLRKALCYAFESEEVFTRYLDDLQKWLKEINDLKGTNLSFGHFHFRYSDKFERCGEIRIYREHDKGRVSLIHLYYISLQGHVVVGLDGRTLRQFPFLKEGGD